MMPKARVSAARDGQEALLACRQSVDEHLGLGSGEPLEEAAGGVPAARRADGITR